MNKIALILIVGILLMNSAFAYSLTDLEDELSAGDLSVSISPEETKVTLEFNSEEREWETFTASPEWLNNLVDGIEGITGEPINFSFTESTTFSISEFLKGVNFVATINEGAYYPEFSNVEIINNNAIVHPSPSALMGVPVSSAFLLNSIIGPNAESDSYFSGTVEHDTNLANELASRYPSENPCDGTTVLTKLDNSYIVTYAKGIADVPSDYQDYLEAELIKYSSKYLTGDGLINDYLLPIVPHLDDLLDVEELELVQEGLDVELENLKLWLGKLDLKDVSYSIPEDTFPLANGEYDVPVTITIGNESITKEIHLTLSGLPTVVQYYRFSENACEGKKLYESDKTGSDYLTLKACQANIVTEDYTLEESETIETEVLDWVDKIENLPSGVTITAAVLTETEEEDLIEENPVTHITPIQILTISLSANEDFGGDIFFKVDKAVVSNPNKVVLYVLEGTEWTPLETEYLGDTATQYEFSAHTPHFSTFMIGIDTTPSHSGSNGNGGTVYSQSSTNKPSEEDVEVALPKTTPQEENLNFFQRILRALGIGPTGQVTAVDGTTTGSTGTLVSLGLTVMIIALAITILAVRRRK